MYCGKDLESVGTTVETIEDIISRGKDKYSPQLVTLLEARVTTCKAMLSDLEKNIAGISSQLVPTHERVISILRSISAANTRMRVGVSCLLSLGLPY